MNYDLIINNSLFSNLNGSNILIYVEETNLLLSNLIFNNIII